MLIVTKENLIYFRKEKSFNDTCDPRQNLFARRLKKEEPVALLIAVIFRNIFLVCWNFSCYGRLPVWRNTTPFFSTCDHIKRNKLAS